MESITALLGDHVKLHTITDALGNWAEWSAAEALEHVAMHGALFHVHIPEHTDSHGVTIPAGTYALTLQHVADAAPAVDPAGTETTQGQTITDAIPTQYGGDGSTPTTDPAADAVDAVNAAPADA